MTKKLHLGVGKCYLPPDHGWVNVDLFSNIKADAYHDVTNLPFEKSSFDTIYCSHLLEHVHRHVVPATLNHWGSLLKHGGTLRLAVPDFGAICRHYTQYGDIVAVMGLLYGAQDNYLNRHTVAFDEEYLTFQLQCAGFVDIRRWDWRETEHSSFDDYSQAYLPKLQKETGMLMSLNLEATKP